MYERRITVRFEKLWDHYTQSGKKPLSREIVNQAHFNDMWDACNVILIDSQNAQNILTYDHIGMEFIHEYGMSLTNRGKEIYRYLEELYQTTIPALAIETAKKKKPLYEEGGHSSDAMHFDIRWRMGLLPFVDESGEICGVISGMRWGAFDNRNII